MKKLAIRLFVAAALNVAMLAASAQTAIVVAHTGVAEYLAAFVAKEHGFFKAKGLDVTFQQVAGGALVSGLQGGSVQMATLPPTNLLLANEGGLDLVAVAGTSVLEKGDQNVGLLVGTSSGIASAKDLVGKKIGVPSIGGFLYVMARKWLIDQGVDVKTVDFVEVNFPQTADLIKGGSIQAGVSAEPFLKRAVGSGAARPLAYFPEFLPPHTTGVMYATTRAWAAANPAAVKGFKSALLEAIDFAVKNPAAARADMGKYIKLPPEALAAITMPRLDADMTEDQLRFWSDAMLQMGLLKQKADTSKLIVR